MLLGKRPAEKLTGAADGGSCHTSRTLCLYTKFVVGWNAGGGQLGLGPDLVGQQFGPVHELGRSQALMRAVLRDESLGPRAWLSCKRGSLVAIGMLKKRVTAEVHYPPMVAGIVTKRDNLTAPGLSIPQAATRSRHPSTLERLARAVGLVSTSLCGRVANASLQPVEEVAFALEAVGRNCLNRLVLSYGDKLRDVLREARVKPSYGSVAELGSLLGAVLSCQQQA